MQFVIVSGSHRLASQTGRVSRYMAERIPRLMDASACVIDLSQNRLPLWDEAPTDGPPFAPNWPALSRELEQADGFIFATPEWGGMASGAVKNFFLFCQHELAHKPALIVAVSESLGGAYPVAELRMSSYKNTHVCYIPEHVIVRNVSEMLYGEYPGSPHDGALRTRIDYSLQLLNGYAVALQGLRRTDLIDLKGYPYGM